MEHNIQQNYSGMQVVPTFDNSTGEYGEPMVGENIAFGLEDYESEDTPVEPTGNSVIDQANSDIMSAIQQLHPNLEDALAYADDTWDELALEKWNKASEEHDYEYLMPRLDMLMQEYQQALADGYQASETAEEEPELTQKEVDAELDALESAEPEGTAMAYQMLQKASQASDPIAREIYQAAAGFHRGELDANTAINSVLNKYDFNEVVAVYDNLDF